MSKKSVKKVSPMLAAQPTVVEAAPVVEAAAPAVLTKRNRVPTSAVLVYTGKKMSDRAEHTKLAWDVVAKILPATAAQLVAELDAAALDPATQKKLVSFSAYISYMIRRGALAPKAD